MGEKKDQTEPEIGEGLAVVVMKKGNKRPPPWSPSLNLRCSLLLQLWDVKDAKKPPVGSPLELASNSYQHLVAFVSTKLGQVFGVAGKKFMKKATIVQPLEEEISQVMGPNLRVLR